MELDIDDTGDNTLLIFAQVTCNLTPAPAQIKITPIDGLFRGDSQVYIYKNNISKRIFYLDLLILKH